MHEYVFETVWLCDCESECVCVCVCVYLYGLGVWLLLGRAVEEVCGLGAGLLQHFRHRSSPTHRARHRHTTR